MTARSGEDKVRRRLRVLGRLAFRYLTIQCLSDICVSSETKATTAQLYLLETLVKDLERTIESLHRKRKSLGSILSSADISTPPLASGAIPEAP